MFLQNAWYPVAWGDEIADGFLARKVLGRELALFRDGQGQPRAIANRCPHRFAPLSLGKRIGDAIQCPYHGLHFGADGRCVHNPHGDGSVPDVATPAFPARERHKLIWVWMGEAALATDDIGDGEYAYLDAIDLSVLPRGYMPLACDYRLVIDNLMDPAHTAILHGTTLASEALTRAVPRVWRDGDGIRVESWAPAGKPSFLFGEFLGNHDDPVDHWAASRWQMAGLLSVEAGVTAVGGRREDGLTTRVAHLVTPETETTAHYFWAAARNFRADDAELSDQIQAGITAIFDGEDRWMLEAIERSMDGEDFWALRPAILPFDRGAVMVRRALESAIKAETAPKSVTAVAG
ncbi:Rieske 2Fe-2S domain-containing protein [Sphingomonas histidinilytica]|uniref:aromatic ring-hydroxylating dioxygenase subunit alpha n=1 Tax=Rhizorhabdus histidinilytica TaxID=439228 RepID=UPI001ADC8D35|nr:aromatic ring-hydroxylating dioxygenase subunit alpha [Rhizorhabdus histidinilytica]MBO9379898.1 Rieske 2Fe-2S domain-containing protein [Rhizorhabdus histidinilytica]